MDSATLTVELVDRSGPGAAAATNPNAPGAANVPGTGNVADFQETVTQRGAGANAGAGSSTGASQALPQASTSPAPTASPTQPSGGLADPMYSLVRDIYNADANTTAKEIASTLGITEKQAGNYLAQARDENTTAVAPPTPSITPPANTPAPTSPTTTPPANTPAGGTPAVWNGPDSDELQAIIERAAKVEAQYPKAEIPQAPATTQAEQDNSLTLTQAVKSFTSVVNPVGGFSGIGQSLFGSTGAAVGNLAQTAINATPAIIEGIPGASAALAPLLSALAPVAAYAAPIAAGIGVAAAAVAVPVAAGYAIANEAERAILLGGRYSPDIQREQALADVRQLYADLRTANRVGDEAGAYSAARSRLDANLQNLRDQVGENLIPVVTSVVETVSGMAKAFEVFGGGRLLSPLGALNEATNNNLIDSLPGGSWFKFFRDLSIETDPLKDIDVFNFADMYAHLPLPAPFSETTAEVDPKKIRILPIPGL